MSYVDRNEVVHPEFTSHRYVHSDKARVLEKFCRCALNAFARYLNTPETRMLVKTAKRLGIK